ncbi:hypothetical protein QYM41_16715 [Kocuria sp. CPCC 205268]|uniref:hypothetical protein n=1 Tax=Kocuria oxytropis TaxID=3058913 RepID=UPI0034D67B82
MRNLWSSVLVVVGITVAIGLLTAVGWPGYVMGAGFGLSLWGMLWFGSFASVQRGTVPARTYATAAAVAVPLGYVFYRLGAQNGAWWAPAFILAGAVLPAASSEQAAPGQERRRLR